MASPGPTRALPKHLKATYLADQEFLLEETRATKLYFFPLPVVWTLFWGVLALVAAGALGKGFPSWGAASQYVSLAQWTNTTTATYVTLAFALLFVVGLFWLLVRYFRWISTVYAVTTRRVIIQKGILGRDFDEIPVTQVRGVDIHQSFFQRVFGYGSVRVSSEGGARVGNEDWYGIPKPFRFQKLIEDATQGREYPVAAAPPPPPPNPTAGAPPSR
jgi:membrane protein YdbS with pleckstrin-like domain